MVIQMNFKEVQKLNGALNIYVQKASMSQLKELKNKAKTLKDTRVKKKCTYKLWDIICVIILAVLSNCNDWEEIEIFAKKQKRWLRGFLQLTGGIPDETTYERVSSMVEPQQLNAICVDFMLSILPKQINPQKDFYHFDGKVDKEVAEKTTKIIML